MKHFDPRIFIDADGNIRVSDNPDWWRLHGDPRPQNDGAQMIAIGIVWAAIAVLFALGAAMVWLSQ